MFGDDNLFEEWIVEPLGYFALGVILVMVVWRVATFAWTGLGKLMLSARGRMVGRRDRKARVFVWIAVALARVVYRIEKRRAARYTWNSRRRREEQARG